MVLLSNQFISEIFDQEKALSFRDPNSKFKLQNFLLENV